MSIVLDRHSLYGTTTWQRFPIDLDRRCRTPNHSHSIISWRRNALSLLVFSQTSARMSVRMSVKNARLVAIVHDSSGRMIAEVHLRIVILAGTRRCVSPTPKGASLRAQWCTFVPPRWRGMASTYSSWNEVASIGTWRPFLGFWNRERWQFPYSCPLSRSALPITETDEKLIASAAISGLKSQPTNGYNTPAAIGIPSVL